MTSVDAVLGAEALVGRTLTAKEMQLVKSIVDRKLDAEATWGLIRDALDVKTMDIVRLLLTLRLASSGKDLPTAMGVVRADAELRMKKVGWA